MISIYERTGRCYIQPLRKIVCIMNMLFHLLLVQNRSDAHKALNKNGIQINGVLIVGVKPVDPMHRQTLDEKLNNPGFMVIPPVSSRTSELLATRGLARPYNLQNGNSNARQSGGTIASPSKSLVSKVMDLMFGV